MGGVIEADLGVHGLGEAKIEYFDATIACDQDVVRLQVAVQDPGSGCAAARPSPELNRDVEDPYAEYRRGSAAHLLDVLHDDVVGSDVVELTNVGVVESRYRAGFGV